MFIILCFGRFREPAPEGLPRQSWFIHLLLELDGHNLSDIRGQLGEHKKSFAILVEIAISWDFRFFFFSYKWKSAIGQQLEKMVNILNFYYPPPLKHGHFDEISE